MAHRGGTTQEKALPSLDLPEVSRAKCWQGLFTLTSWANSDGGIGWTQLFWAGMLQTSSPKLAMSTPSPWFMSVFSG